jgi:hypothetical protein
MIEEGEVVFTKVVRTSAGRSYRELKFNGHLIVLVLGHVKQGGPDPDQVEAEMLCMRAGLFHEVLLTKFFGDKEMNKFYAFAEKNFEGRLKESSRGEKK